MSDLYNDLCTPGDHKYVRPGSGSLCFAEDPFLQLGAVGFRAAIGKGIFLQRHVPLELQPMQMTSQLRCMQDLLDSFKMPSNIGKNSYEGLAQK